MYSAVRVNAQFQSKFYVAGVSHYNECEGKDCTLLDIPHAGDSLVLHIDENNPYDENIEEAE